MHLLAQLLGRRFSSAACSNSPCELFLALEIIMPSGPGLQSVEIFLVTLVFPLSSLDPLA